jgi:phosphoglucosamine mutase
MFGTSGVRGEVGQVVTAELALDVGRALAAEGYDRVVVGRDPRESGRFLADAASAGLRESGAEVLDAGVEATPTVARAVDWLDADAGVVVTASHNPPCDNGIKLWTPEGRAFDADQRGAIEGRIADENYRLASWDGVGSRTTVGNLADRHVDALTAAVDLSGSLDVVVDLGNGAGRVTADALAALGCDVTTLNGQRDGAFPGRASEPTAESCATLRATVAATDADLGVAHDGDADRMMAVTGRGAFVTGDVLLALFAGAVVEAGDRIAAPVNTSLAVEDSLAERDVSVVRTRVGDGFVAAAAAEDGVVFGGEPSGAWVWPAATLAPDGPLAACRLVELVAERGPLADLVAAVDTYPIRRESLRVERKDDLLERVRAAVVDRYGGDAVEDTDGVRVAVDGGWFLVRASGTQPLVRVTAEARAPEQADDLLAEATALVETARRAEV